MATAFNDCSAVIGPPAVKIDGGEEGLSGLVAVVAAQCRLKVARLFGRDGFEVAYAAGMASIRRAAKGPSTVSRR